MGPRPLLDQRGGHSDGLGKVKAGDSILIRRRLLNISEVAEFTGLSVHTLYTMVSQRRIPFVKVGRLTKFDLRLLDEWIAKNTVMPMPPKCEP
jgi:excisionase family DNA binding protein